MYAFHSFSRAIGDAVDGGQFTALYLTSGVTASLASLCYKVAVGSTVASLGASGAILGIVSFVCSALPNSQLLLLFIPMSANTAIKAIMTFDTLGLFMRWSLLDHAAHLGGTLYGQWVLSPSHALHYSPLEVSHNEKPIDFTLSLSHSLLTVPSPPSADCTSTRAESSTLSGLSQWSISGNS